MISAADARHHFFMPYIADKKVLDLWVWDIRHRSLHIFMSHHASHLTGVELDPTRAHALRDKGYTVITGNAEDVRINEQFDVVVAGDLIEHINNVGLFLSTVKMHLAPDGMFVFNTPNAYAINLLMRGIFLGWKVYQFDEHASLYTQELLAEVLQRHGFAIERTVYFTHPNTGLMGRIIAFFGSLSQRWHENIMIVAKRII